MTVTDTRWLFAAEDDVESKSEETDREAKHKDDEDEGNLLSPGLLYLASPFA
jgi:hypothetical protein